MLEDRERAVVVLEHQAVGEPGAVVAGEATDRAESEELELLADVLEERVQFVRHVLCTPARVLRWERHRRHVARPEREHEDREPPQRE